MINKLIFIIISLFILGCQTGNKDIENKSEEEYRCASEEPYKPKKEMISDPGFGECPRANGCECDTNDTCPENSECIQLYRGKWCVPKIGSIVPRFRGVDQFGDIFDLYDLAGQGKPILLEIGSGSAKAAKHLSAWRSHISDEATKQKWWKSKFHKVRDLIDNHDIYWVHILHTDENKNPATAETVKSWYEKYPHNNIIMLADPDAKMKKWIRPTGLPCMVLIDENMILQVHTLRGIEDALDGLYHIFDSK
tara:strand:- start:840 stop:1592 length:753 start_codon:yes stop_codon:yes gene_type:complete